MDAEQEAVRAGGDGVALVDAWSPTYDASDPFHPILQTDWLGCHLATEHCERSKVMTPLLALLEAASKKHGGASGANGLALASPGLKENEAAAEARAAEANAKAEEAAEKVAAAAQANAQAVAQRVNEAAQEIGRKAEKAGEAARATAGKVADAAERKAEEVAEMASKVAKKAEEVAEKAKAKQHKDDDGGGGGGGGGHSDWFGHESARASRWWREQHDGTKVGVIAASVFVMLLLICATCACCGAFNSAPKEARRHIATRAHAPQLNARTDQRRTRRARCLATARTSRRRRPCCCPERHRRSSVHVACVCV
jgi:chemotaxis protein histidine kinase CheA